MVAGAFIHEAALRTAGIGRIRRAIKMRQKKWMAQVLCAFFLILSLAVPAVAGKKRSSLKSSQKRYPASENLLVNEMLRHLGVQYRRGGSSPSGVDCSGYVGLVYRNAYGLALPHQSASLYLSSDLQKVPLDELKTGDLLFFTSSTKSRRITHVGIYLSEGRFVHAASRKGVIVSSLSKQYYRERIAGARRVIDQPQLRNGDADSFASSDMDATMGTLFDTRGNREDLIASHSFGLELGQDRDFQVSLFQDSLFSWKETDLGYSSHQDFMGAGGSALSTHVQGVRVGKNIRPFQWLVITPSLSYLGYEGDLDETGLPRRALGLDLSLGSRGDAWKVSTGIRYLSLIPPKGYSDEEHLPEGIDMSLTYSRRLSEGMSIVLIGERLQRYQAQAVESVEQERTFKDQRFSIVFNFSY